MPPARSRPVASTTAATLLGLAAVCGAIALPGCGGMGFGRSGGADTTTQRAESAGESTSTTSDPAPIDISASSDSSATAPAETQRTATIERPARPLNPQERVDEARTLADEGRIEDAIAQLAAAIRDNPKLTAAYVMLAELQRESGNYRAAEESYRRAVELEPRNFDALYNHALTLQLLDRTPEAIRQYLRALAVRPDDLLANLNLATAYLQLGEANQALPYAQRAAEIDPSNGPARANLGAVYSALERHRDAVTEFEAAAEHMDLSTQLLLNLADSLGKIQRYQEMANTLERALAIEPRGPNAAIAWERLGSARFRLRQYDAALDCFQRAVALDPSHFPAFNGVGVCLLNRYLTSEPRDLDALNQALSALRSSLRINERQPRIVELLARYG